jgi:hypothetical protein
MFEQFSRGYYMGRLYVEPSTDEIATMCREQHEWINEQLYGTGEGVERLDNPLVMKLGSASISVHWETAVPPDTPSIPEPLSAETTVTNPPTLSEILLAKADRAAQLLKYREGGPGSGLSRLHGRLDEPAGE